MCGILGQISNQVIDKNRFRELTNLLNHRGPDDNGTYYCENIAFGHTRLSLIDLSKEGHQPMVDESNNFVITYNGEIYNFVEIRNDLIRKGYSFHSTSDTEVILKGFIEYREKIVGKLNGMFAFAIYEKSSRKVFFARDRGGIKPLYYCKDISGLFFSSEIKVFRESSRKVNLDAKILFLLLGYVPEPITIYKDIYMFPAGHYGFYSNGKFELKRYDEYIFSPKISKSYSEIVSDVSDLLHKSIQRHLISDAPIGTFLSGGLDSSAITAIATKYKTNIRTLSLIFNENGYSEEGYQDMVVKRYGTQHTKYLVDKEVFLTTIESFIDALDQPSIDGFNTFLVARAAKDINLKAVLSGVGGDEIFYGYPSFKNARKLNFLNKLPKCLIDKLKNVNKLKKLELLQLESNLAFYLPTRALFTPTEIAAILDIEIGFIYDTLVKLWEENYISQASFIDDKIAGMELDMYMKNQLLRDTDVFGMINSIEIRVPFLDKDLVDYVLRISPKEKFNKNINKIILADVTMALLPHEIFKRPKMGFVLPFEKWFKQYINEFDLEDSIKNSFLNGKLSWSRVWALLVIQKFS